MKTFAVLRCLVVSIVLTVCGFAAHADFPKFTDNLTVTETALCKTGGVLYLCMRIEDEGAQYLVLFDKEGVRSIYSLEKQKINLLWARDSV